MLLLPGPPLGRPVPPARPRGLLARRTARAGPEQGVLRGAPPTGRRSAVEGLSFPDAGFARHLPHVTLLDDSNE